MPGKVKVKIIAGRNLPVMDRSSDTTDAYVEIKLGNTTYKTDVCRKSLNPQWNTEWYRFEVDDSELQDEPLQIRLMDHDTYSANDAIGKVYLNLNPLLIPPVTLPTKYSWSGDTNADQPSSSVMSGWIPVYDTMHGIRGEVNVTVKVELFSDFNKFRQSSCGVQFFCSPVIPHGYHAQVIHGFIEELVVNDDPEYQWIDKIRTPRASNEARQTLFFKLSGELQRKIGVKAIDLGGNAVIGYNQCFDLEGESGIVARGIGTVMTLVKHHEVQPQQDIGIAEECHGTSSICISVAYLDLCTKVFGDNRFNKYLVYQFTFLGFCEEHLECPYNNGLKLDNDNIMERFTLSPPNPSKSLSSALLLAAETEQMQASDQQSPLFIWQHSLIEQERYLPRLKPCLSSRSLSDDIRKEIALNQLLQRNETRRASNDSITRKIKSLRSFSQNTLTKKMFALKARLSDAKMPEDLDCESTSTAVKDETNSSLIDLREVRKRKKMNNNSYMAQLLVKSVMQAHTSLDCILECHDTNVSLSSSTSKLNEELTESGLEMNDETENVVHDCKPVSGRIIETISEPNLLLPDVTAVTLSSNASSSSDLTSSDEDISEGFSDMKEEDKLDFDTVSLIVKNVQEQEEEEHKKELEYLKQDLLKPVTTKKGDFSRSFSLHDNFKIGELLRSHVLNPIEEPCSSSNIESNIEKLAHSAVFSDISNDGVQTRKKGMLSRGLSKSCEDMSSFTQNNDSDVENNSFMKYFMDTMCILKTHSPPALRKSKHKIHSHTSDLCSKSNPDLNNQSLFKMMTSQPAPVSPTSQRKTSPELRNYSLTKTAMQTILMDKLNLMTSQQIPLLSTAEEEFSTNNKKSFSNPELTKHTSLKNILTDKVQSLTTKSPLASRKINSHLNQDNKLYSKSDPDLRNQNSIKRVKSLIIDKVHQLTSKSPLALRKVKADKSTSDSSEEEFQASPEKPASNNDSCSKIAPSLPSSVNEEWDTSSKKTQSANQTDTGLVRTAIQTMLMDRLNILTSSESAPSTPMVSECAGDPVFQRSHNMTLPRTCQNTIHINASNLSHSQSDDILHSQEHQTDIKKDTGLENISTSPQKADKQLLIKNVKSQSRTSLESPSIVQTAMQTMLMDRVNIMSCKSSSESEIDSQLNSTNNQTYIDGKNESTPEMGAEITSIENANINKTSQVIKDTNMQTSSGVVNRSTIKTILPSKFFRNVKNESSQIIQENVQNDNEESTPKREKFFHSFRKSCKSVKNKFQKVSLPNFIHKRRESLKPKENEQGLIESAMTTILMDRVNNMKGILSTTSDKENENCTTEIAVSEECVLPTDPTTHTIPEPQSTANVTASDPKENSVGDQNNAFITMPVASESTINVELDKGNTLNNKTTVVAADNMKGILSSTSDKENENCTTEIAVSEECVLPTDPTTHTVPEPQSTANVAASDPKENSVGDQNNAFITMPVASEPTINVELDKGNTLNNKTTVVAADDPNCNTNAQHARCLYPSDRRILESPVPEREPSVRERHGHQRTESTGGKMSQSPARLNAIPCIHRRSSDSDLSITPKGNSLTGSDRSGGTIPGYHYIRSTLLRPTVDNFDMMEYPFLTMAKYPPGFILHLGGAVSARSVKLLERITNIEEPESRDTWWSEIRMEIRTHARALNCNAVLGYTESTSICDEVCVLSASGTAAVIALYSGELSDGVSGLPNLHKPHIPNKDLMTSSLDRTDFERDKNSKHPDIANTNNKIIQVNESPEQEAVIECPSGSTNVQVQSTSCRICHIPYSESNMSLRVNMLYCTVCKMAKVPDILLATVELPDGLPITGRGCFLQSYVCRPKRDLKGELNAKEISESLPFLEYELHRLLVNKMKVKAMNTIFGLKVRITIGEKMLVGIATGTAVFLLPLPPPPLPKVIGGTVHTEDMQKRLVETVKQNKEIYELKDQEVILQPKLLSDTEESDDEKSALDLTLGNKDSCILEVDDAEEVEAINLLLESRPPDGFHVVNTENVPGLEDLEIVKNLQMFTQVWRAKIFPNQPASHFGNHFQKLLKSVYFKLRRMIPCALCDLQFRVDLPEPDEIQLTLLGMALGLGDPMKLSKFKRRNLCNLSLKENTKKSDDELIFSLEEDHIPENSVPIISQGGLLNAQMPKHRQKSPQRLRVTTKNRHTPIKERHGVDITPLSYVPGGKIERYLGYLNFFFIRETTSIREGGGLSGFVHSFITEVLAIVRAHVTALGGNAMVAYFMTECILYHNAHKNQGQCLINVGGDVVFVSYFSEDI